MALCCFGENRIADWLGKLYSDSAVILPNDRCTGVLSILELDRNVHALSDSGWPNQLSAAFAAIDHLNLLALAIGVGDLNTRRHLRSQFGSAIFGVRYNIFEELFHFIRQ